MATQFGPAINKTREKLMLAAEHLLRTDGLARLTTRAIARQAGVAEGTLYHHFNDKAALLLAIVRDKMSDFRVMLDDLLLQVGQRTVTENLEQVLHTAYVSQQKIAPVVCSLFADRKLLASIQKTLAECGAKQTYPVEVVAAYLAAEQRLGRVAPQIAPRAVAESMLGGSFHAAIFDHLLGHDLSNASPRRWARDAVQAAVNGLAPRNATTDSVPAPGA